MLFLHCAEKDSCKTPLWNISVPHSLLDSKPVTRPVRLVPTHLPLIMISLSLSSISLFVEKYPKNYLRYESISSTAHCSMKSIIGLKLTHFIEAAVTRI